MISFEQIQQLGHIVELERRYINQYGSLFHNLAYRETSTIFVLQQTIEPTMESVPGIHGVDAKSNTLNAIEIKSANLIVPIYSKIDGTRYNGSLGKGHRLNHSSLVGKFDKMQSEERFERVKQYDAYVFSIFANRHIPEVVFYIKAPSGVDKIRKMIESKREDILKYSDTSSFKGTIIDIRYESIFNDLTNDELNILVDHTYIDKHNDMIQYTQIDKEQYIACVIGSEMPKGNFRTKKSKY